MLIKILHIIASVDPRGGGPIAGICQQAAIRDRKQFSMEIASLDRPDDEWVTKCPVKTIALGRTTQSTKETFRWLPWVRYGYQTNMVPWLKKNRGNYDIVVVNGLWNYATMAARCAIVGSKVPYVVYTHGMLDPWFKRTYPFKSFLKQVFWLFNEGPLLNNASAVLFTSDDEKEMSRNAFWPYRVREHVVGYGSEDLSEVTPQQLAVFKTLVPKISGRKYILYLSRIHPKKGCDLLIGAFSNIATENPNLDLVIAGPDQGGWKAALQAQTEILGIADRIHWPGMIQGDAKLGAYHGCEAFILPSHQENFGIVVSEALSSSTPVLISNKVQIWREVEAGGGGIVEPDTQEGTIHLLRRFLALDPESRAAMGRAARATFLDKFELSKAVGSMDAILKEVVHERTA